jgi:hypothetical protein
VLALTDILELETLYRHLEENTICYSYREIANLFQKMRDKMHTEGKTNIEKKAQWEMDFFNFSIVKNVISPLWTLPDKEGKMVSHPRMDNFSEATYDYLVNRFESVNNPLLKARYAHILWFSPRKHGKYAIVGTDCYLEEAKLLEGRERQASENHLGLDIINAIENAFYLAKNIGDKGKIESVKSEILRLIFSFNSKSGMLFRLRTDLMNLMVEEKTIFSVEDLKGLSDLCLAFSNELADTHQAITFLQLGEKVEQRTKTQNVNWLDLIAQSYEKMMNATIVNNKHVAIGFCQSAIENYKQSKNTTKVEELEKIYAKLKNELEFKEIEVKMDLTKYIEGCRTKASSIAQKYYGEQIVEILMLDKNLLPEYNAILDLTKKLLAEHPLQTIFPTTLYDEQGHVAQHFDTPGEIEFYHLLHQYRMSLENFNLPFIYLIIKEAFAQKKLTYPILMEFLKKRSWFGKTFTRNIQNQSIPHNWLHLLAPSLFEYFRQMDYHYTTGEYPNLVLCMDSLTLKIEGLLRDLLLYSGVTTFYSTQDKSHRTIYREKDINALLHEEKVKDLFNVDDLLLFRSVLVEKAGYNLRHKVAHSLILREEYRIDSMNLLLLILLRLARYDVKPANNQSPPATTEKKPTQESAPA